MAAEAPLVTIGILSFNRRDEVRHTLQRVAEQTYEPVEVLVVDNASSDGTAAMVREEFPDTRVIALEENVGEEAKNPMLRGARGDIVVILDDDSYPAADAVGRIVEHFTRDPSIGVIAGKVYSTVTGEPWPNPILPDVDHVIDCHAYIGCGVAMRRRTALDLGGYAGFFFIYEVETELALRFWAAGHRVIYDPAIRFDHRVAPAHRTSERQILHCTRNTLEIAWMYARGWRRLNLTLGTLMFFGRAAWREGEMRTWRRAWREARAQRPVWSARRMEVPESAWRVFRPWLRKYQMTSIIARKLGLGGR